jgi:hypothetical protein
MGNRNIAVSTFGNCQNLGFYQIVAVSKTELLAIAQGSVLQRRKIQ